MIITGRLFQGVSFGIMMPLRPVLVGEYTSPRYRGSFLTTISLFQGIGVVFVHSVGSQLHWQYTAIICCLFPLVSFIMTLYSPESPSWLAVQGRYDDCRNAYHWLRGEGENEELEKMIRARIIAQEEHDTVKKMTMFKDLTLIARKKEVYKPVLIAIHVYLLGQFCGALTLANYSPMIIGTLMGDGANANFWMIELDVLRLVVNTMAVFVMAGVRRRTIVFGTGALCVATHAAIVGYTYCKLQGTLPYDSIWIPALLLNIQMATIGFGMVPMSTVITGEIFPLQYRGVLGMMSSFAVAGSMFMILKTFPGLYASTGLHGTYAIYCGVLVYSLAIIWFMLPETKGKTLQQIEEHFRGTVVVVKGNGDENETVPLKTDPIAKIF